MPRKCSFCAVFLHNSFRPCHVACCTCRTAMAAVAHIETVSKEVPVKAEEVKLPESDVQTATEVLAGE